MSSTTEFIKQIIGGPSDFGWGWIMILLSAVFVISDSVSRFSRWFIHKTREKNRFLEIASQLDTGAHISHFITLLGNPVSINKINNDQEYIFVNRYFYTQAITTVSGEVSLFSVTTRRRWFHPILKDQFGSFLVKLGKTNFLQLGNPKDTTTHSDHGGINLYSEAYYFGYDGHYRTYFFSINTNGYGGLPDIPLSFVRSDTMEDSDVIKKFRSKAIINTYTVSSLFGPDGYKELGNDILFGPRYYQIRVSPKK